MEATRRWTEKKSVEGSSFGPPCKANVSEKGSGSGFLESKKWFRGRVQFWLRMPECFLKVHGLPTPGRIRRLFFFLFLVSPGIRCRRRPDTQSNEVITMPIKSKEPKQKQNKSKVTTKQKNTKTNTKPTRTGQHERQSDKLT